MTTDTEAGNKIIAEFMGYKYRPNDTLNDVKGVYRLKGKLLMLATDFKYHSSWDWLMPVVEKIEGIKDEHHGHFGVHISSNGCTIQATNFRPDKPITTPPHYFSDHTEETKLKATWLAVIEFINWYQSQQTQPT